MSVEFNVWKREQEWQQDHEKEKRETFILINSHFTLCFHQLLFQKYLLNNHKLWKTVSNFFQVPIHCSNNLPVLTRNNRQLFSYIASMATYLHKLALSKDNKTSQESGPKSNGNKWHAVEAKNHVWN